MAYWHIQRKDDRARWLLSRPATLADLYAILATSRGKPPRGLFDTGRGADPRILNHWTKATGSTQKAISWWTG